MSQTNDKSKTNLVAALLIAVGGFAGGYFVHTPETVVPETITQTVEVVREVEKLVYVEVPVEVPVDAPGPCGSIPCPPPVWKWCDASKSFEKDCR